MNDKQEGPLDFAERWVLPVCFVICLLMAAGTAAFICQRSAHAAPKGGLWLEQSTQADGVLVRKIRDTFDGNICYIATREHIAGTSQVPPAIACVPERK